MQIQRSAKGFAASFLSLFLLLLLPLFTASGVASSSMQTRVIAGEKTPTAQAPFVGALMIGTPPSGSTAADDPSYYACTATLIAPRWVLTAAHCVEELPSNETAATVVFGKENLALDRDGEEVQRVNVSFIQIHPRYGASIRYDLAVLYLERAVRGIAPVQLASSRKLPDIGTQLQVYGWGIYRVDSIQTSAQLRGGTMRVVDDATGWEDMGVYYDPSSMFAAVPDPSTVCYGDSGGPAVLRDESGVPTQVGITSWGPPKNDSFSAENCIDRASGFVRVGAAINWIRRAMNPRPVFTAYPMVGTGHIDPFTGTPLPARPRDLRVGKTVYCVFASNLDGYAGLRYGFRWYRNGKRISNLGRWADSHRLQWEDSGGKISCGVTLKTKAGAITRRSMPVKIG